MESKTIREAAAESLTAERFTEVLDERFINVAASDADTQD
ncbi:hypothetical protein CURTO8I2_180088 [Curtobacterium sp. 8I-2]|jgi:hypothetical protein|nr:hypothetical protein CURTO8I2_180088 [Curtobacterium sp. 8I-2]